jgi:hypothetical protein
MIRKTLAQKAGVFLLSLFIFSISNNFYSEAATPIALNVQATTLASPYNSTYTGSLSASITTTAPNTILVAYVSWEGGTTGGPNSALSSFTDGSSTNLTWTKRIGYYNTATQSQEVWWAFAPNIGTYTGTANWVSTNVDDSALNLMAFTGVDQSSPWDSSSATTLPAGTLSAQFSTIKSNTYLLGFFANDMPATPATPLPSGTVSQISYVTNGGARWYQYSYVIGGAVASVQNNINLGWTSVSNYLSTSYVILDALKASGQNVPISINSIAAAQKNQTANIVLGLPSSTGKVSVYANGRPVARCFNISVGAVSSFTCPWKPTTSGATNIYATFQETGSPSISSRTSTVNLFVNKRTTAR